jgi:ketosteroid isomerase-like protein
MSQENVERTRLGYEAFNRGDIDGTLDLCAPDIEWQDMAIDTPPIQGRDALRSLFEEVRAPWDEIRREPEEIIDLGEDRVLVLFRTTGRGRASGIEVEARGADLLTLHEGLLIRWAAYADRAEALDAAGLRK